MANTQVLWKPSLSNNISKPKMITIGTTPFSRNSNLDVFSNRKATTDVKVNKDLLAISCHLWRNFKDDWQKRYLNFSEAAKTLNLTQIDYDNATLVMDYFSKHILIKQLKGELTSFQQSVLEFITSDRMTYDSQMPGLIYRLPEYYETDQRLLKMKEDHYTDHNYVHIDSKHNTISRSMKPILKVNRNTSQQKVDQYWFIDVQTNNLVMIDVDSKNQIKYIWDNMFETLPSIMIQGDWENKSHSLNFNYMTTNDWHIDFIREIA